MKERPILFKGEMVRAILSGSKTQTRRIVKQTTEGSPYRNDWVLLPGSQSKRTPPCPYGAAGDRLWVREAHWYFKDKPDYDSGYYQEKLTADHVKYKADNESAAKIWFPSIHMPRLASRITLEITSVRIEKLNSISEADALAEGVEWAACGSPQEGGYRAGFARLWESINGAGSWDANPWVWVIEFKMLAEKGLLA